MQGHVEYLLQPRVIVLPRLGGLSLVVTSDGLYAYLVCPCSTSLPLQHSARVIAERIHQAGLRDSVRFPPIHAFAESLERGNRPDPALVASGTPPSGGWLFTARIDRNGQAKARLPGRFAAGETVCERIAADSPADGKDVWGNPVESRPYPPPAGDGIAVRGDRVVAERNGFLVESEGRCLLVDGCRFRGEVLSCFSPLIAPGHVHVAGNLPSRTRIEAQGDVCIEGSVDNGARVIATGSIRVMGTAGRCVLQAEGGVSCTRALGSKIEARGDVEIHTVLGAGARVSTRGRFSARDGSRLVAAVVEALEGADLWACAGKEGKKTAIYVGLTQYVDRRIALIEREIRAISSERDRAYDRFSAAYGHLIDDPQALAKAEEEEVERFEKARAETTEQQQKLEEVLSALKSRQRQLTGERARRADAVVSVRRHARPPVDFWLRNRRVAIQRPVKGPFVVSERTDHSICLRPVEPAPAR